MRVDQVVTRELRFLHRLQHRGVPHPGAHKTRLESVEHVALEPKPPLGFDLSHPEAYPSRVPSTEDVDDAFKVVGHLGVAWG